MFRTWWQRLFALRTRRVSQSGAARRGWRAACPFLPRLEHLEDRLVPSGDPYFGTGLRVVTDITGPLESQANAVVMQGGGILVVGTAGYSFALARYNLNGALDITFGTNGIVQTEMAGQDQAYAVALQPDGKILVAGSSSGTATFQRGFALARYTANGVLDTSFGTGGKVRTVLGADAEAYGVAVDPLSGAIVAVGQTLTSDYSDRNFAVARYDSSGTLLGSTTTDFVTGGSSLFGDRANAVVIQGDGKIVVTGRAGATSSTDLALARYNTDLSLDIGFDGDGKVTTDLPSTGTTAGYAITLEGSNILVAGEDGGNVAVVRYNANGSVNGQTIVYLANPSGRATGIFPLGDGRLVVGGFTDVLGNGEVMATREFMALRFNANLTRDATFGTDGRVTARIDGVNPYEPTGAALDGSGRVVVARAVGTQMDTDFGMVRFTAGGVLDTSFDGDGKVTTALVGSLDNAARALLLQPDGKLVAVGNAGGAGSSGNFALFRYNRNGTLDTSFGTGGRVTTDLGYSEFADDAALLPDGRILVVGSTFGFVDGNIIQDVAVARYNANGTLDTTFDGDGKATYNLVGQSETGHAVALLADGRFLVAGSANPGGADHDFFLARFSATGALDATFAGGGVVITEFNGGSDAALGLVVQPDDKIVVVGSAGAPGVSTADFALARYNAAGTLDATFGTGGRTTTHFGTNTAAQIEAVALQPDGMIVVAGSSGTTVSPYTASLVVARYTTAGALDPTFDGDGKVAVDFGSTAPANDFAHDVLVQPDGKILAVGQASGTAATSHQMALARLNANGTFDPTFDDDGKMTFGLRSGDLPDGAHAAVLLSDGRVVVAGRTGPFFGESDLALVWVGRKQPQVLVAPDRGGPPRVKVFDTQGALVGEFDAYGSTFTGGVRVAAADVTNDGAPDIFTAPGPTGAPFVNIFDGVTFAFLRQFQVYGSSFTLGVNLAVGNVVGDASPEIVVAPERGGQPWINVVDSRTGQLVKQFLAYGLAFTGGVRIALANTDAANGALLEILTGPQAGGAPYVNQFNAAVAADANPFVRSIQVYGTAFTGGLFLAAGLVNSTGLDDFVVGPGSGGQPYVNCFDGTTGQFVNQVQAYGLSFTAGVRVAMADTNADGTWDIVTGPGPGGEPWVQIVNGATEQQLRSFLAFAPSMTAGLFVLTTW